MAPPKAVLFDIGGVCVISPMLAIANYESAHSIPRNWINFAISRSGPRGAWQRIERGEAQLDKAWFEDFSRDLHSQQAWREFHATFENGRRKKARRGGGGGGGGGREAGDEGSGRERTEEAQAEVPPMPQMDATTLFWMMMIISRTPDPDMKPALERLRGSGRFVLGALSNTVPFPEWHPYFSLPPEDSSPSTTAGVSASSASAAVASAEPDIRSSFDVFVGSADVGLRKPDRRIYELAVERLDRFERANGGDGIEAKDVVFLDDIGENLKAARKVGMRTVRVWLGRTGEAVGELEALVEMGLREEKKAKL